LDDQCIKSGGNQEQDKKPQMIEDGRQVKKPYLPICRKRL
jgi:hypothetical protein